MAAQSSNIFLSYRREDSAAYAGRVYDRLAKQFGPDQVFMDIDHIEPGDDFVDAIRASIDAATVLVVLIGPEWTQLTDAKGERRLDKPDDFVRLEIATAFNKGKRVIPLLVGGAHMPASPELPDSLQPLTRKQSIEISDTRFHDDVNRLIATIQKALESVNRPEARRPKAADAEGVPASATSPADLQRWLDAQGVVIVLTVVCSFVAFGVLDLCAGALAAVGFVTAWLGYKSYDRLATVAGLSGPLMVGIALAVPTLGAFDRAHDLIKAGATLYGIGFSILRKSMPQA